MLWYHQWGNTIFGIINNLYGFSTARSTVPTAYCGIIWTWDNYCAIWLIELNAVDSLHKTYIAACMLLECWNSSPEFQIFPLKSLLSVVVLQIGCGLGILIFLSLSLIFQAYLGHNLWHNLYSNHTTKFHMVYRCTCMQPPCLNLILCSSSFADVINTIICMFYAIDIYDLLEKTDWSIS